MTVNAPATDTPTDPAAPGESSGNNDDRSRGSTQSGSGQNGNKTKNKGKGNRANKGKSTAPAFKGNTSEMNGHVFQTHAETTNKQQFQDTVAALAEYINKELDYAKDVASLCRTGEITKIEEPEDVDESTLTSTKKLIWKARVETYVTREGVQESNKQTIFSVIWGQCSPSMQAKVQSLPDYETKCEQWDCAWLLKEVKSVTHMFEGTRNKYLSIDDARENYSNCRQQQHETVHEYMRRFRTLVEVLEHYGAKIGNDDILVSNETIIGLEEPSDGDTKGQAAYRKQQLRVARDKSIAMAFMKRADRKRFGSLWADLQNLYARGHNQYPDDLTTAYNMLVNYKTPCPKAKNNTNETPSTNGNAHMSFLQQGDLVPGTDGVVYEDIKCFRCNQQGHYRGQCPVEDGAQFLQLHPTDMKADAEVQQSATKETTDHDTQSDQKDTWSGFSFAQANGPMQSIPPTWVLLDSQSTVSVFRNKALLRNVRRSNTTLKVHTNGGTQVSTFVGDIPNFGKVWYNPASLANILSMAAVRKVCRITMDSAVEPALFVHKSDGTQMKFQEFASGLYYYDTATAATRPNPPTSVIVDPYVTDRPNYTFINTVADNKRLFTQREVERADAARKLFKQIDSPSYKRFEHYLRNNLIRNCPLTVDDVRRSLHIYGPDPAALKGKTVNKGSKHVNSFDPIRPPAPILHFHQEVTLGVDILYINGIPFITTVARKIKFRTIAPIPNRAKATLLKEVKAVKGLYEARGFTVTDIHADQEFACMQNDLLPTRVNIANTDDHVPEVERSIRTIKERVRATIHSLPFQRLPKLMVRAIADKAVRSLNHFPAQDGVSDTMSPLTIMTGKPNLDYGNLTLEFGAYAQVFEANEPTNTTKARVSGAIALNATDNEQGGYYFMSLATGKRLSRLQWECLPMPDEVIARVEHMAQQEGQRLMGNGPPLFEWTPGIEIRDEDEIHGPLIGQDADENDEMSVATPDVTPSDSESDDESSTSDNDYDSDPDDDGDDDSRDNANTGETGGESAHTDASIETPQVETVDLEEEDELLFETEPEAVEAEPTNDTRDYDSVAEEELEIEEAQTGGYNLRPNRERSYEHRLDRQMDEPASTKTYDAVQFLQTALDLPEGPERVAKICQCVVGLIFTQMTATAGIKKHGQPAIDALFKEFAQLDTKTVFEGVMASSLTPEQKREALRAINLIKEKRSGTLKGRTCADGRPQRKDYTKEETTSPTVSNDSLTMSSVVDGHELRDVAVADVTGAYLNADMDVFTLLKLTGDAVDIMCKVNPDYEKFVTLERGKKVLYLRLLKALYGCVRSALLWYELFASTLQDMGFELNPYDPCVANKMINGHQCTILWYVDDTKISHKDPAVVSAVIEKIEEKFGKMTVSRGRKHTFLGTDMEFKEDGTVVFQMKSYLEEAIADFGENVQRKVRTPATKSLFNINEESPPLDERKGKIFHSVVAKLLYVAKRARLDIQLPVAFLCTRVAKSTEQDWEKLRRLLQFIHCTLDAVLVLGADDLSVMLTWVDAAYAVHVDMRSHTGGCVSFGRGAIITKSSKQKINTKSSTEAELVGASDYLPGALWLKRFLAAQGYELQSNTFYQDNQSAMKLEMNGRKSAGQKSRHIDIRYFFIKDRVETEDIRIEYCATERMLADFFTKPLQGGLFQRLRAVVMGHEHVNTLAAFPIAPSKERVEPEIKNGPTGPSELPDECESRPDENNDSQRKEKKVANAKPTYADVVRQRGKARILFG